MTKALVRLRSHTDLWKVIMTDEEVRVDLDQYGRCAVAQRRGINPGLCRSNSTKRRQGLSEAL
jgi:hypothetical protein